MARTDEQRLRRLSRQIAAVENELDSLVVSAAPPRQVAELRRRLTTLTNARQALRDELTEAGNEGVSASEYGLVTTDEVARRPTFEPPVAEIVVESLEILGATADGRLVSQTTEALHGIRVPPSRIAVLRRDDERAFRRTVKAARPSSIRPVLVCPAIHFDRLVPVKGRYVLSSWEPRRRVVGPRSLRRDHLEHVRAVSELVAQRDPDDPGYEPLARLLWQLGRTVAGALRDPGRLTSVTAAVEPARITAATERELSIVGPVDDPARDEAADRVAALEDPVARLFGAPDLHVLEASRS